MITAIGNDYGFNKLFSRQIEANGLENDIFIGISTSGNSENIIQGLIQAKKQNLITVGLTGNNKGNMDKYCNYHINIPK